MAKQVFDVQPSHGISAGQSNEHLRNYSVIDPEAKKYGYYDPTRMQLNFEVGKGGMIKPIQSSYSIVQRFKDNLRNRGIKDPNDDKIKKGLKPSRRTIANIILQGSRDRMMQLAFGDQQVNLAKGADNSHIHRNEDIEKWALDMYNYIAKKYGEENIVAFVVHLDEKNPHIHCTLVPVVNNKISWKKIFSGKNKVEGSQKWKAMHDEVAGINKKWGLERGDDINVTGAKHRTSEEYWQYLKDKCEQLEVETQDKQESLDFLDKEYRRTDIKVKGLSKMLENLTTRKNDIVEEIQQLEEDANNGRISVDELQQKAHQLHQQLEETEQKIKDKKEKLDKATEQLDIILDQKAAAQHKYDDLQRAINREKHTLEELEERNDVLEDALPEIYSKLAQSVRAVAFTTLENDCKQLCQDIAEWADKNVLSPFKVEQLLDLVDSSLIGELAAFGQHVVAVAGTLYLGNISQAMTFAQSCGGGGNAPDNGWGRKPDEDDEAFLGRCFGMARLMMRPSGKVQQRRR